MGISESVPSIVSHPERRILASDSDCVVFEFTIPPDLVFFKGHFDTKPIVPGFVLVGWVIEFHAQYSACKLVMTEASQIKFLRPIGPGENIRLKIVSRADVHKLDFHYLDGSDGIIANGHLRYSLLS